MYRFVFETKFVTEFCSSREVIIVCHKTIESSMPEQKGNCICFSCQRERNVIEREVEACLEAFIEDQAENRDLMDGGTESNSSAMDDVTHRSEAVS